MLSTVINLPEFGLRHIKCKKIVNLTYVLALLEKVKQIFYILDTQNFYKRYGMEVYFITLTS